MAIQITDPIYKTDVIQVSEMPQLKRLDDDALLLVSQSGNSRSIKFKSFAENAAKKFKAELDTAYFPAIAKLSSDVKSLHYAQDKESDRIEQVAEELSTAIGKSAQSVRSDLQSKLTDVKSEEDKKVSQLSTKLITLSQKVDILQLSSFNAKISSLSAFAAELKSQTSAKDIQLQKTIDETARHLVDLISESSTEDREYAADVGKHAAEQAQKQIDLAKSELCLVISDAYKDLTAKQKQAVKSLQNEIEVQGKLEKEFEKSAVKTFSKHDSEIETLSVRLSSMSDIPDRVETLEVSAASTLSALNSLDIMLYGIRVEVEKPNGEVETQVLKSGDITFLSSTVRDTIEVVKDIQNELRNLKADLNAKVDAKVIHEERKGMFSVDPQSLQLCALDIALDGYVPISICEIKVTDNLGKPLDNVIATTRYIESAKTAMFKLVSTDAEHQAASVTADIMYMKI